MKENKKIELTVLMPCLNEAVTLAVCIRKAKKCLKSSKVRSEILVADNGSTDGSQKLAQSLGARVIHIKQRGYGAALLGGIRAAKGKYIVMADSDDSYDFSRLSPFIKKLKAGYELVMGNRFQGGIQRGAMPFLHKYLGNPVLSKIGQFLFRTPVGDFHCGLRAFHRSKILQLNLSSPGMEFASEMLIAASLMGLKICEVPVQLFKDGRGRRPHLRTWRDGFRHLRVLLGYSPRWLFFYPGIFLMSLGSVLGTWMMIEPIRIGEVMFETHTMFYAWTGAVIGLDLLAFSQIVQRLQTAKGVISNRKYYLDKFISFEILFAAACILLLLGVGLAFFALNIWSSTNFSNLHIPSMMRIIIPSSVLLLIGTKFIFFAFFFDSLKYVYVSLSKNRPIP